MKGLCSLKGLVWSSFWMIVVFLMAFFLIREPITWGGDIAEYYGTSESILNHGTPNLTSKDRSNLEQVLNPEYFEMKGYYVEGFDGQRYPVHFIFYSILTVPMRLFLQAIGQPEIKALTLTNIVIFAATIYYIFKDTASFWYKKLIFLIAISLSPLIYFIAWPGPDIYYLCLMMLSFYFFFQREYFKSTLMAALASWHSQPLLIFALGMLGYYVTDIIKLRFDKEKKQIAMHFQNLQIKHVLQTGLIFGLLFIPYLYNLIVFGVFSPWAILQDFWTEYYGFGLHNASLKKLIEQFVDPNIGLFWYLPVGFIFGGYLLFKQTKQYSRFVFLIFLIILTALAYQTNPAWHYGTSGYGPTRHAIFIMPLLVLLFVEFIKKTWKYKAVLGLFVITQLYILSFNGWITPNWLNVLNHSPYAKYLLNYHPALYNPTPEIFVDRTNHTDIDYPTSAFYKHNDLCTKAYVLRHERHKAVQACGYIPEEYEKEFVQPKEIQNIEKERTIKTTRAILMPRSYGCDPSFKPVYGQPYVCMKDLDDVIRYTGIIDVARIRPIKGIPYAWELGWGRPQTITVPPGYGVEYYMFEGVYINY